MKVYLNDEKKSVDPRLHLKRVGIISWDHCVMLTAFRLKIHLTVKSNIAKLAPVGNSPYVTL